MRQQKAIDFSGGGRTALETAGKALCAASDAESAGFSAVLLTDTDLFIKGQATIICLQLVECVQE